MTHTYYYEIHNTWDNTQMDTGYIQCKDMNEACEELLEIYPKGWNYTHISQQEVN